MTQETGDAVRVDARDGVLTITINRPEKRNAVNREVAESISAALDRLDADSSLRVGVLTGAGETFCAGLDLGAFARGEVARSATRGFAGIVEKPPTKPLIGAAEGWALGGGLEILLCCDLIVAAETARFGLPEVTRGLVARGGGAIRLTQRLPRSRALEMLLTGEPMTAEEAWRFGLVNKLAADGEALGTATELARLIAANAPLAVAASKRVALESPSWPVEDSFALQGAILEPVFSSEDAREGALAFQERRPARWSGR
ncbi:enoyl-CoA hydratase [Nocardioides marmoriginsengisoli]|uniref:Enoyl-CoA hydratase n=1 Tax=Nocardioides marmoriginsengisoli TaxID=661483 RepID=A0A3N0CGS2_9ACTN|nr:crotonase/enoyl-CoA hydratase family protein [Nocardioides marmoriginsengisoli]RNL62431.1 enoyl-CoA hydratase [Nocardioides marmoriginsengisoli]